MKNSVTCQLIFLINSKKKNKKINENFLTMCSDMNLHMLLPILEIHSDTLFYTNKTKQVATRQLAIYYLPQKVPPVEGGGASFADFNNRSCKFVEIQNIDSYTIMLTN